GPGLLLLGWGVARTLNARARRLAQTGVVFLALARSAALLYGGHEVLGLGRVDLAQQFPREVSPEGRCLVRVDGTDVRRTLASLVGSAAPYYDCTVEAWDAP
ncbi:MAG TPA: hypothetical protein VFA49_05650, partial [Chloroflexota bacterium]|nr:hypothetical protein [Chloroflexota bacterium]